MEVTLAISLKLICNIRNYHEYYFCMTINNYIPVGTIETSPWHAKSAA